MNSIKINNSEKAAVKNEKWKNPGAKLYNELLNSFYDNSENADSSDYVSWDKYLKEAYLIAPVNRIKNSPHGRTPYSRSGCKYPHHIIKGNELVLSLGGVKAAYARAKQQGIYKGEVKDHLDRHMKELGLMDKEGVHYESLIEDNFIDIESFLMEKSNIDLSDDIIYSLNEKSHGKLHTDFRAAYDFDTGHLLKIVYSLDNIEITNTGRTLNSYMDDEKNKTEIVDVQKNIRKTGNLDHQSKGQKVKAIVDLVTNKNLQQCRTIGIFTPGFDYGKYVNISDKLEKYKNDPDFIKKYVSSIKVGEIDNVPSFKSTYWFKNTKSGKSITDLGSRIGSVEKLNNARGIKVNNHAAHILGDDEGYIGTPTKQIRKNKMIINMDKILQDITTNVYHINYNKRLINTSQDSIKNDQEDIKNFQNEINSGLSEARISMRMKWINSRNDHIKQMKADINHYNDNIKLYEDKVNSLKKEYIDLFTKLNGHSNIDSKIFEFDKFDDVKKYIKSKNNKDIYFKESLNDENSYDNYIDESSMIDLDDIFTEKSHGKLKYDYRVGYDADTGHKILLVYSLDNINVDYPGHAYEIGGPKDRYSSDSKYKDSIKDVTANIRKKGNIDHSSYGQKLLAIKDLVTNKPLKEANYVGIFKGLNSFGSSANGDKQLSAEGLKKTLQSTTPFHIKVGEVETDTTFKSTKIIDSFDIMAKSELSDKYGRGHKINTQVMPGIYKTPTNKDAFQKMIKYVNTIVYDRNIRDGIKMIDNWNNGNVELSLQGSAKKYKITSSIIQKYIDKTNLRMNQIPDDKDFFNKELNHLTELQNHVKQQGYIESTDIFIRDGIDDYSSDEYITEKSHSKLKYCYRVGFDVTNGKEVAIEFDLDSSKITGIGDERNIQYALNKTSNTSTTNEIRTIGLDITKRNIARNGYIDFTTDELRVSHIFYKGGDDISSVTFIPLFSKIVVDTMNSMTRIIFKKYNKKVSSRELFEMEEFQENLVARLKVYSDQFENYQVGEYCGKGKYKTTKLLWDRDMLLSYKYTPVLRGYNKPGRGENLADMQKYIRDNLNSKFESTSNGDVEIFNSMISESTFWGESYETITIPYNNPIEARYVSHDEDGYIESIIDNIEDGIYHIDESFNSELEHYESKIFTEASHAKLKYDYRQVYDADTGHRLICVYTMSGINVTYPGHAWDVGSGYNMHDGSGGDRDKYNDAISQVQKNIAKKGNTDHQSYGQRLIAVKDAETGEQWSEKKYPSKEFKVKGYFQHSNSDPTFSIKLGEIESESNKSYKSSKIFRKSEDDPDGMRKLNQAEASLKYGRGAKLNDFDGVGVDGPKAHIIYNHPSKKDIRDNPVFYPVKDKYGNYFYINHDGILRKVKIINPIAIIPNTVKEIGNNAFAGCKSLKSVKIPDSVSEIGIQAFCRCRSLESITIPNSVKEISNGSFEDCKSLRSITIPNSVIEIGDSVFYGCKSLPDNIKKDLSSRFGKGIFESTDIFTQGDFDDYAVEIPDDAYINNEIEESFAWMDSVLYGDLFEEKKSQEEYAREHFKKKYKYDPKTSTIEVNGKRIKVNMNNNLANDDISANNHTGCINLGKNFFRLKSPERRDATLMHEIGHLRMHANVAGMGKENPMFDKRFLSLYNMGNDFIDDLYGCKTVEEAEKRVRKKLEDKYIDDDLSAEELANTKKMIDIFVKRYNVPEKFKSLNNPNFSEARYIAKKVADEYLKNLDKDSEHLDFHEIEADRYAANKTSESTVRKGLRNSHKIQRRYLSKHPNSFMLSNRKLDELLDPVVKKCEKDPKFQNMDYNAKRTFLTNELTKAVSEYMKSDEYKTYKSKNIAQDEYIRRSKALKDPVLRNSPIYKESVQLSSEEQSEIQNIFDSLSDEEKAVYGYGPGIDNNTCYVKIINGAYIMLDDYTDKTNESHPYPGKYVGIAASKSSRGKGITDELIRFAKKDNLNDDLIAIIENDNHASINLFTRNGFILAHEKDGFSWYIFKADNNYIRSLTRKDVTNPYFVKWIFNSYEFKDDNPENFDFDILINNPKIGNYCYGYFINNNLEGIIKIKDRHDYYSISMFFVNDKMYNKGIGQKLLNYAIDRFGNNELRLHVFEYNTKAIYIYKKYGFEIIDSKIITKENSEDDKFIGQKIFVMSKKSNIDESYSDYDINVLESNSDHIYTMHNLPDKLYFASPMKLDRISGRVFMTPHIGIASIFIINRNQVMKEYFSKYSDHDITRFSYNNGYDEWDWSDDKLQKPLTMVHMTHNVPEFTQTETGSSSGFIHVIDISGIKDKLKTFVTNDPDRELIYEGAEPLKVIDIIPHTVNWEIRYDEDNFNHHGKGFVESTIEGSSDNPVLTSDFNDEVGAKTPQALYEWMHKNIDYDKSISKWRLRDAAQLYLDKKGNCHDQSYFESFILHSWGYKTGQLFFIEYKKGSNQGGNTHTLTWYYENDKLYWFENAWADQAGIHGPYNSMDDLKNDIITIYHNDIDINSHEYDGILFANHSNYRLGMTLGEYVESWDVKQSSLNESTESNVRRFGSVIFENGEFYFEAEEAPPSIELDDTESEEKDSKKDNTSDIDNSTEGDKSGDTNILDEPIDSEEPTNDSAETSNEESTTEDPSEPETPAEDETSTEESGEEEEQSSEPEEAPVEEPKKEEKPLSLPKQTDAAESDKNGVRRKKLYIAFIEWCKEYNNHNTFGSIFDKDAFKVSYPFIPDPMRYFYRLANPMLCVLGGQLTFFPVAELRKINSKNKQMDELLIFAATPNDLRIFNKKDNKVYRGTDENGTIKLNDVLGETFDLYIQKMVGKGDILNAPLEEDSDTTK